MLRGYFTHWVDISSGVSQGSALGLILFLFMSMTLVLGSLYNIVC